MNPDPPPDNGAPQMPRGTLNLDAELVWGGLWEGAPVVAARSSGKAHEGVVVRRLPSGTEWRVCSCGDVCGVHGIIGHATPTVWTLSLRLPGHRGSALHVLTEAIKERVGIDSRGKLEPRSSGSTWRAADDIAKACRSGDEYRIAQASKHLVMTDALAAELGWPAGKGAPVWSWTTATDPHPSHVRQWKLSARASSKESWSHWFDCRLADPMAALEDVWRRRGGR